MISAVKTFILGGARFTALEAQTLQAAARQGLTREQARSLMRSSFNRGVPNAAFAEARTTLTASQRAGIRLTRLSPGQRLGTASIPKVVVTRAKGRYILSGRVTTRIVGTDIKLTRIVRFATNEAPTMELFRTRANEILQSATARANSAQELDELEEISVIEQVPERGFRPDPFA